MSDQQRQFLANEQFRCAYYGGWNMTAWTVNGVATTYTIKDRNQASAISGIGCTLFDINGNMTYRVYDGSGPKTTYTYVSTQALKALFRVARSSFPLRTVHTGREMRAQPV